MYTKTPNLISSRYFPYEKSQLILGDSLGSATIYTTVFKWHTVLISRQGKTKQIATIYRLVSTSSLVWNGGISGQL